MNINFFISHSKETKTTLAIPFAQSLSALGFNVWIDRNGISTGQYIYTNIRESIANSTYCIAIIDHTFLAHSWTLEELRLFHLREDSQTCIIPIYVNIGKSEVYTTLQWLEGRAFEKINQKDFNAITHTEILCRIVGRYYKDCILDLQLNSIEYDLLRTKSFPCKETLLTLLDSKAYYSQDFRIAIIEICNIIGVASAIYTALTTIPDKYVNISSNFANLLRDICFDTTYVLTYNMYISALYSFYVTLEKLKVLLNSC